jgi:hypothetical protein
MQGAVNTTTEEELFSMWFGYIFCWATDVFSMGPSRDCISSPVVGREQESSEPSAVKEEGFG